MKGKAGRVALGGLLAALALALSYLEGLLPPLPGTPPGFKLGLSNLAPMTAAGCLGVPAALLLAALKGGFAFLTRGAAAGLMSLAGGMLSAGCTGLLLTRTKASYLTVGICGALAHNAAQLACAMAMTSPAALYYAPLLALYAALTGALTGTLLRAALPLVSRAVEPPVK